MEPHKHDGSHSCCSTKPHGSVQQSLMEMEFERGIWTAALNGEEDRVRKMLSQGTDANAIDSSGFTALHYAARNGHLSVCRTLLGKGADVNMRTRSGGATALHRASYRGQLQVVNLLLEAKADKLLKDNDGQTALHKAADRGHSDVIQSILSQCKELKNIQDNRGRFPMDCYQGKDESIKDLLKT